jgi:hypothetical protein
MTQSLADIAQTITRTGFAFVGADDMRAVLEGAGLKDWGAFAKSWGDLGVDTYMADGGRYRRRRFAVFRARGSAASPTSRITRAATTTRSTATSSAGSSRSRTRSLGTRRCARSSTAASGCSTG